jgi:hypothetical protein
MKGKQNCVLPSFLMVASIGNAQTNKFMQNKNFAPEQK